MKPTAESDTIRFTSQIDDLFARYRRGRVPMSLLINAYCTHRHPPRLSFPHQLNNRRDANDPEFAEHLNGFIGYIMQGGQREMTQSLYHVYRHLQRVQHHLLGSQCRDFSAGWIRAGPIGQYLGVAR
jgi:hypothetical protein